MSHFLHSYRVTFTRINVDERDGDDFNYTPVRDHFDHQAFDLDEANNYAYTWADRQDRNGCPVRIINVHEV